MIRSETLLAVALVAVCGCAGADDPQAGTKKGWPLNNVRSMPSEIGVISGTKFLCGGVPCQLLGVKESADPAIRAQAEKFTRAWFKSIGNYIMIYNAGHPLVADDGTCVVWVRGYDSYLSCLSEELVRAGLAEFDDARWAEYGFMAQAKEGEVVEDWRGELRKAREGHQRGEALRVLFDWPPKPVGPAGPAGPSPP